MKTFLKRRKFTRLSILSQNKITS